MVGGHDGGGDRDGDVDPPTTQSSPTLHAGRQDKEWAEK